MTSCSEAEEAPLDARGQRVSARGSAATIEAVAVVAAARGVSRAQVALAWLRKNPVVVAPIAGATKASDIDEAVASLAVELTDDEVARLEAPYTPRSARIGTKPAA